MRRNIVLTRSAQISGALSREITHLLLCEGWQINRKRVQCAREKCVLREYILARASASGTYNIRFIHTYYEMLRHAIHPNHVWGITLTYIRLKNE